MDKEEVIYWKERLADYSKRNQKVTATIKRFDKGRIEFHNGYINKVMKKTFEIISKTYGIKVLAIEFIRELVPIEPLSLK